MRAARHRHQAAPGNLARRALLCGARHNGVLQLGGAPPPQAVTVPNGWQPLPMQRLLRQPAARSRMRTGLRLLSAPAPPRSSRTRTALTTQHTISAATSSASRSNRLRSSRASAEPFYGVRRDAFAMAHCCPACSNEQPHEQTLPHGACFALRSTTRNLPACVGTAVVMTELRAPHAQ